jgi:hypothetical protein
MTSSDLLEARKVPKSSLSQGRRRVPDLPRQLRQRTIRKTPGTAQQGGDLAAGAPRGECLVGARFEDADAVYDVAIGEYPRAVKSRRYG